MRIRRLLQIVGCVLCLLTSGTFGQRSEKLAEKIQSAADVILSPSASREDVHRSMIRLVETLSQVAEARQFGADFRKKAASALLLLRKESLSYDARQSLGEAYRSLHGKSFVFPSRVNSSDSAAAFARSRISASIKATRDGHFVQAAEGILDFILTVITPMEQAHRSDGISRIRIPLAL